MEESPFIMVKVDEAWGLPARLTTLATAILIATEANCGEVVHWMGLGLRRAEELAALLGLGVRRMGRSGERLQRLEQGGQRRPRSARGPLC